MSKWLVLFVATLGLVATTVGFAAASQGASAPPTGKESANAWLPTGVTPCGTDWPNAACDIAGSAYSPLTQISPTNVGNLKMVWQGSYNGPNWTGNTESQPLVVSGANKNLPLATGTMFLDTLTGVVALDPTTGGTLWTFQGAAKDLDTGATYPSYRVRLSYGNGMIFDVQQDRSLVALNAKTGAAIWTDQLSQVGTFGAASHQNGPGLSLFYNDGKDGLVIAASNSGDGPLRGHEDAFDAKTGKLVWRFFNTPDPTQQPFIQSWANPAGAALGGVAIWTPPAIDPQLGQMYIGTGNAYPEQGRTPGLSLWADSIVSLDIKTGQLKWYYQTVHHDIYDYDCPTPPVLFNTTMAGKPVKAVAVGCKTGYIYVRNRVNGGALSTYPMPETAVPDLNGGKGASLNSAWPTQPIPTGAVAQLTIHCPTEAQIRTVFPSYPVGPNGTSMVPTCPFASPTNAQYYMWADGTDYQRMSYDPKTNDLYVCARSRVRGYENLSPTDWHVNTISGLSAGWVGSVSAINASTNKLDWQVQYQGGVDGPCYSGIITTASGLLFTASEGDVGNEPGTFYAYDAKTGKQLWSWKATDVIYSAPITYSVKGKQYVALMVNGPVVSGKRDLLTVFSL